jgi:hypothetical protein
MGLARGGGGPNRPIEPIYCVSIAMSPHLRVLHPPRELLENILVINYHENLNSTSNVSPFQHTRPITLSAEEMHLRRLRYRIVRRRRRADAGLRRRMECSCGW